MIFAAPGDVGYNVLLVLHIVTGFLAFAPAFFVHPALGWMTRHEESNYRGRLLAWSMALTGVFGYGVVGLSDDVYEITDTWLVLSFIVWVTMNGVLHAVVLPAERAWGDGDDSAEEKLSKASAIVTLLMLVMVYLMVFKPGA